MTDEAMSPSRRPMIEDMTMRKLAPKTQRDYVQRVTEFAAFLGRSPDAAGAQDVRRFQLHLTSTGTGAAAFTASATMACSPAAIVPTTSPARGCLRCHKIRSSVPMPPMSSNR